MKRIHLQPNGDIEFDGRVERPDSFLEGRTKPWRAWLLLQKEVARLGESSANWPAFVWEPSNIVSAGEGGQPMASLRLSLHCCLPNSGIPFDKSSNYVEFAKGHVAGKATLFSAYLFRFVQDHKKSDSLRRNEVGALCRFYASLIHENVHDSELEIIYDGLCSEMYNRLRDDPDFFMASTPVLNHTWRFRK